MAEVALEVITPVTNFADAGSTVFTREQSRLAEPTIRTVATANKVAPVREKPTVVTKPPSAVKRAWNKPPPSSNDSGSSVKGSEGSPQGKVTQNGKDVSTVQIPKDARVSILTSQPM